MEGGCWLRDFGKDCAIYRDIIKRFSWTIASRDNSMVMGLENCCTFSDWFCIDFTLDCEKLQNPSTM